MVRTASRFCQILREIPRIFFWPFLSVHRGEAIRPPIPRHGSSCRGLRASASLEPWNAWSSGTTEAQRAIIDLCINNATFMAKKGEDPICE